MLRRPWEVSRITAASTPISLPILREFVGQEAHLFSYGVDLRFPVLDHRFGGVDDGAVHVEEEAIEGELLRREVVLWLRAHDV